MSAFLVVALVAAAVGGGRPWSPVTVSGAQAPSDVPSGPRIYTLVGNGAFSVDDWGELPSPLGKRATDVEAPFGADVAIASNGDLLALDGAQVWRIGPDGIVRVAAGIGRSPNSREPDNGDGGPAVHAFVVPNAIVALPDGGFLVAEQDYGRVRRVWSDGSITSVAGSIPVWWGREPADGRRGDDGPATKAIIEPLALALSADGGFLVLEPTRVRRVAPDGTITTVAGTGAAGFSGDGGPAVRARIRASDEEGCIVDCGGDIAATSDGGFLIADTLNHRIRKVSADGRITTVAGDGRPMPRGDGGPAVRSSIRRPIAVAPTPDGGFRFFEDTRGTIREVSADGTLWTVVGGGESRNAAGVPVGDGGPARDALVWPSGRGLLSTPEGGWIFTDFARIRLVTPAMVQWLSAGVRSVGGRARAPEVRISSTAAGTARVTLRTKQGRVAARATQPVTPGDATIRLAPVERGAHWLDLTVTDATGRHTSTRLAIVLGPVLDVASARHAVAYRLDHWIRYHRWHVGRCRRVNDRRVDCEARGPRRCTGIHAVTLRKAFTFVRRYGCRAGIRPAPRWREPAQPWPALGKPPL